VGLQGGKSRKKQKKNRWRKRVGGKQKKNVIVVFPGCKGIVGVASQLNKSEGGFCVLANRRGKKQKLEQVGNGSWTS